MVLFLGKKTDRLVSDNPCNYECRQEYTLKNIVKTCISIQGKAVSSKTRAFICKGPKGLIRYSDILPLIPVTTIITQHSSEYNNCSLLYWCSNSNSYWLSEGTINQICRLRNGLVYVCGFS